MGLIVLPPDTRVAGQVDPPGDADKLTDAAVAMYARSYISPSGDPSGVTDLANLAIAEATSQTVFFAPGTYWGNFVKQPNLHWQGSGRAQTIMKAPAASNAPVLTSAGFAGLTLTGSTGGVTSFAIRDMTFDGNASAQSVPAAFGVGIYGCDYLIENVSVRNCLAIDGLYTEWSVSGSAGSAPDKSMESMYRYLRVHDNTCTGADWHHRGPHDSSVHGCWIYNGTTSQLGYWPEAPFGTYTATGLSGTAVSSTPSTVTLNSTISLPTAGTATIPSAGGTVTLAWTGTTATTLTGVTAAGGSGNYTSNTVTVLAYSGAASMVYGMHVWGTHSIAVVADAATMFHGCEAEGATTGQVLIRSGTQWNGGRVFAGGATAYGFQLGDTTNQASQSKLNWPVISGFTGGVASKAYINVVNEAQGSHEALCILSGTNQAVFGTFATASHHKIIFEGGGSTTPAIVAATGAGTGPPTPTVTNATDMRALIGWGTGTTPLAAPANQVLITYAQPKPGTPAIAMWPMNAATAALGPYLANVSTTGFNVGFATTPAASQIAGFYQVGFADVTG
jgi:hypothetical protein